MPSSREYAGVKVESRRVLLRLQSHAPVVMPGPCATTARFTFLPLYEGAADECTNFDPPLPDSFRPPTSAPHALPNGKKAWMAGSSPAKGTVGRIGVARNIFLSAPEP